MAENTVAQPTQNPTRKLTAAVIASAVVANLQVAANLIWPHIFDAAYWATMYPIAAYLAGYFVKDEATVVLVQQVVETEVPAPTKPAVKK